MNLVQATIFTFLDYGYNIPTALAYCYNTPYLVVSFQHSSQGNPFIATEPSSDLLKVKSKSLTVVEGLWLNTREAF